MKKYLFVLSAIVLFAFSSCQKVAGDLITKEFAIEKSYTALEVQSAFVVTVSEDVDVVTVTVGENVMPNVVVEVKDNTLKIHLKPQTIPLGGEMKALIPYNADLTKVVLSGASEFHTEYTLTGDDLEVELSGASDFYGDLISSGDVEMELSGASTINGNVAAQSLDMELSGASDAALMGLVKNLKIELSGASNIVKQVVEKYYGLMCENCEGTMSGASDAYIHCDGYLKVDLSGASNLHFTGNGNPADCTTSGGSDVIHDVIEEP